MAAATCPNDKTSLQAIEELVLHGASCFVQDNEGNTALHHATTKVLCF